MLCYFLLYSKNESAIHVHIIAVVQLLSHVRYSYIFSFLDLLSIQETHSCLTLCDPMDYSLPGSSVHGIAQARILEWAAISSSRGSSQLRRGTLILCIFCIGRWILYHWATWGAWNSILMVTPLKFKSQSSVSGKMWTRQVFHFCEEI